MRAQTHLGFAVALTLGCSYESDWEPRRRDATPDTTVGRMDVDVQDATAEEDRAEDRAPDTLDGADTLDGTDAQDVFDVEDRSAAADVRDVFDVTEVRDAPDAEDRHGTDVRDAPDAMDAMDAMDAGPHADALADADASDAEDHTDASDVARSCGGPCPTGQLCLAGACVAPRSCPTPTTPGCGWVVIRGGTFTLGSTESGSTAVPQEGVSVDDFAMDAYEVTVARFRVFWQARTTPVGDSIRGQPIRYPDLDGTVRQEVVWGMNRGREPTPQDANHNWSSVSSTRDAHPVNGVDWWTAQEFCVWDRGTATYGTAQNGRLPTEAEWEYATRHRAVTGLPSNRRYPWGNTLSEDAGPTACDRAQFAGCAGLDGGRTRPVGSLVAGASGGLFDLAGNVAEWTADYFTVHQQTPSTDPCVNRSSRRNPFCNAPVMDGASPLRAIRGGAFNTSPGQAQHSAFRINGRSPATPASDVGFRCVFTVTE